MEREDRALEKHVIGIVVFVVCGLIGWVAVSINSQSLSIARLSENIISLSEKVEELKKRPYLTRDEVTLLMAPQREAIIEVQNKIISHEARLKTLESDLYIKYPNPSKKVER